MGVLLGHQWSVVSAWSTAESRCSYKMTLPHKVLFSGGCIPTQPFQSTHQARQPLWQSETARCRCSFWAQQVVSISLLLLQSASLRILHPLYPTNPTQVWRWWSSAFLRGHTAFRCCSTHNGQGCPRVISRLRDLLLSIIGLLLATTKTLPISYYLWWTFDILPFTYSDIARVINHVPISPGLAQTA